MAYTKMQQQAIDERGKNLLVAAAAGSGKTQVMVERIINLVYENKVSIDTMLIVTFTNAAATEMKERIHKSLEEKLDKYPENDYLKMQIELLPQASIGTMHSFCIDVIRNNFNAVSIDPGFKMGLDSTVSILKSKIIDELFEEKYNAKDANFISLVDAFGGKTDEKLKELLLRAYNSIQAQPYPIKWLKVQTENYKIDDENFLEKEFLHTMLHQLKTEVSNALEINELALKYANHDNGPFLYIPALENDRALAQNYKNLIEENNIEKILDYLNTLSFERAKSIKKSDLENGISESLVAKTKSLRDEYKKRLKDTSKILPKVNFQREIEKLNIMYPYLKALEILIEDFDKKFEEGKRKKGILDFNDLEHLTLKIFENENIKQQYKSKFSHIFFDEYQDSNLVQETIIESIKKDNNLFFVGDVKQAIYRFRLSEPMLFNQRYKTYELNEDGLSCKIDLSKNFRSNKKILDFTNFVFKSLMSDELGQVDYSKEEVQLLDGMDFPDEDGGVEFNIINLEKTQKKDATIDSEDEESSEDIEYKFIVEKIKTLIGNAAYRPKEKLSKPVEYGDIAVLFRSPKGSINKLSHLLSENDIPNIVDYEQTDATSVEVLTLYDYLKIIDNRFQDEALLGALTSFLGVLNIDDIINIKIKYPEEKFLYNAVDRYREENIDSISEKLNIFFKEINTFKKREGLYELSEFIWQIIKEKGYLIYLNSLKMGKQRRHNVIGLLEKAKEFSEGESNKLFEFLLYIDKIFKDKQDKAENVAVESENAVKLMSIHKSKGLEFPIVILCDTKKKFNEQEYKEDIIFHNKLGIGSKFIDISKNVYSSTLPRNVIISEKKQEALSEEVRILYVAFTRAINKLIIVGATKNFETSVKKAKKGKDTSLLKKINNYFEWILTSLWPHKAMENIRNIFEDELLDFEISSENLHLIINIISEEEIKLQKETRVSSERELRKKLNRLIEENTLKLGDELKFKEATLEKLNNVALKVSVTEIAKKDNKQSTSYGKKRLHKTPKSLQIANELSSMEKGTLMHSVLEHLNLKRNYTIEEIKQEICNMIKSEKLTTKEAEYIDIESIHAIFTSEIGEQIRASKEIHKEESFLLRHDNKIVDGVIDCYFIDDNNSITLIDYKTDKKIEPNLYAKQLQLYKIALEKQYKTPVANIYIYWFKHKKFTKL